MTNTAWKKKMSAKEFKNWILKHKTIDTIIIGYFIAEAISRFYKDSFDSLFYPILTKVLPGDEESEYNFFGAKIKIHKFILTFVQLLLSIYLAFLLRKALYASNGN